METEYTPTHGVHGKGRNDFVDFSNAAADVVLTRGCMNSKLFVILPDWHEHRVILRSRNRRARDATIEAWNFSVLQLCATTFINFYTSAKKFASENRNESRRRDIFSVKRKPRTCWRFRQEFQKGASLKAEKRACEKERGSSETKNYTVYRK